VNQNIVLMNSGTGMASKGRWLITHWDTGDSFRRHDILKQHHYWYYEQQQNLHLYDIMF